MAAFELKIELGNEAMRSTDDVVDALLRVIAKLQDGHDAFPIRDVNGNTVGSYRTVES